MNNIDCSNDLGNLFYKKTLQYVIKKASNKEQRQLVDYMLERSSAVQIYNVTDVLDGFIKIADVVTPESDGLPSFIKTTTGIDVTINTEDCSCTFNYSWTPYVDDLYIYSETNNGLYYSVLIHRISDERVIIIFGTITREGKVTMMNTSTVELKALGLYVQYGNVRDSVHDLIHELGIQNDYRKVQYMYDAIHVCFVGTLSFILKMFHDLTDKSQSCRCYVDTTEDTRTEYFRSPVNKKVTKVGNKPIILILNNDSEADKKAQRYKRRQGRIQYAFSWVVRGHYRKLHNPKSIGLDRNGKRCVQGATWIETYMKGDENLPLLRRERVVKVGGN